MRDDEKIALAKGILLMHFGILAITAKDEPKRTVCAGCASDTPWPCPPVRLAKVEQERLLAR